MRITSFIIKISGIAIVLVAIADGILGMFNLDMQLDGNALPRLDWSGVTFMVITGILFFVAGYLMEKRYTKVEAAQEDKEATLAAGDAEFIKAIMKRSRRVSLLMTIIFGLCTLLFTAALLGDPEAKDSWAIIIVVGSLCLICAGGFVGSLVSYIRNLNPVNSKAYIYLVQRPQEVTGLVGEFFYHGAVNIGNGVRIQAHFFTGQKLVTSLTVTEDQLGKIKAHLSKQNPKLAYEKREKKTK